MATDINITAAPGMPPVSTTGTTSSTSTGSEQIVPSSAAVVAQGAAETAATDTAGAEQAVAPAIAQTIEGKAAAADLQAKQIEADSAERQRLIAERMPGIQTAEKLAKDAEERYHSHQFYDYWHNKSTGDRIVSRLAIALNAGANAYLGIQGNELADELQHDMDRDFERQKIALHSKEQMAKWRREGVTDLYQHLQSELGALDVKHAKALEAVGHKAEALALRAGIPEAQAKQNVVTARAYQEAADKKLQAAQRYERHANVRNESGRSASETTAKAGQQAPVFDAGGAAMGATDPESARKVNTELGVMRQAHDSLNRLLSLYNTPMPGEVGKAAELVRDRRALQEEIKSQMPQIKGFTRLTAEDMKVFDAILGGKMDALFATDSSKNLVKQTLGRLEENANATVKAHGVKPNRNILTEGKPGPENAPLFKVKSGKYAGKMARKMPDGSFELAE